MYRDILKFVAMWVVLIVLGLVLMASANASTQHHPNTVRWCPEDAVIVGHGDFDGQRWEAYRCIARDDL